MHPEINRFIQNDFKHGLITDYEHTNQTITGYGKRTLPAFPYVLLGALLSFGNGTLFPESVGQAGTLLLLPSLLWLAFGAVNGSRKKFKVRFSFSSKKQRWSCDDSQYWREVAEFFCQEKSRVPILFKRWIGRPMGQYLLVGFGLYGAIHATDRAQESLTSTPSPPSMEKNSKDFKVPAFFKAILPKIKLANTQLQQSITDPDALNRGMEEIRKQVSGGIQPSAVDAGAPAAKSAPLTQNPSQVAPQLKMRQLSLKERTPPLMEQVPEDLNLRKLDRTATIDLADYLLPEPGYRLILGSDPSAVATRTAPPIELESRLSLTGQHEQAIRSGQATNVNQKVTVFTALPNSVTTQDWNEAASMDAERVPVGRPNQFPRRFSRSTNLPAGYLIQGWGKTVTASWGQIGPCVEWSHPAPPTPSHSSELVHETYCNHFGLAAIEIHDSQTGKLISRQVPVSRLASETLEGDTAWSTLTINAGRVHCSESDQTQCRSLAILLERLGVPFEAIQSYQSSCAANDPPSCAALGDLQVRVNAPRSAYESLWKSCFLGHASACRSWGVLALQVFPTHPEVAMIGLEESCRRFDPIGCSITARLEEFSARSLGREPASDPKKSNAEYFHRRACALGITAHCYTFGDLFKVTPSSGPAFPQGTVNETFSKPMP